MKKIYQIALLFIAVVALHSCKKSADETKDLNKFGEYISALPEKLLSSTDNISFILAKKPDVASIAPEAMTIKPKVKGNLLYDDSNRTLSFVPTEKLQNGKEYTVKLNLNKLYAEVPSNAEELRLKLKIKELRFTVTTQSLKVHSKDWYYIEGVLIGSDVMETAKLQEVLKANYLSKEHPVNFEKTDAYADKVYFKIDSLKRGEDDSYVKLKWDGKALGSNSGGNKEVVITGKNNFKILQTEVIGGDKQQIEISFSDPIQKSQNIKGLIQFTETAKNAYTYKVKENIITVYPKRSFNRSATLKIFKGIKNTSGYTLREDYEQHLYFEELKPTVSFINSGSILPDSDNLKINFKAASLKAVDVTVYKIYEDNILQFLQQNELSNQGNIRYVGRPEVKYTMNLEDQGVEISKENAFSVDLAELIDVESGAMYRVELSFEQAYAKYGCEENEETTIIYGEKEVDTRAYNSTRYYGKSYSDYRWRDRENPCTPSYYYDKEVRKNILASNLGVIVKRGTNDKTLIAVTDLLEASPVQGAEVSLYNLQQQPIETGISNKDGVVSFDKLEGSFFAVAKKGESTSYVKLTDGNTLSLSKFDVAGVKSQKGLKGFVYGERGVWRPGDTMYLTFVLNDEANPLPNNHPISFELENPQGKIVDRTVQYTNDTDVYVYKATTASEALTGNWRLHVAVGGAKFSKTVKVETIKPNRLKIKMALPGDLIKANQRVEGTAEVKWLHGAIARNMKMDITGKFRPAKTSFKGLGAYQFDDVTRSFGTEEFSVFKGSLNNEGKAKFSLKPRVASKAPGMLKASFITKVYENGGDFSTDVYTKNVSPYTSYVGLQSAEEKESKNYLFTDKEYRFNVATVNENGKATASNLEVKVYKLSWRWWWNQSNTGLSSYDGSSYQSAYKTLPTTTNGTGKGSFVLKIRENDWGRYLIKVRDKKSGHITSKVVYFDWPWYSGKQKGAKDKSNATMLVFTADKDAYKVGEEATVKFPSTEGGRAFVTIENGEEVLDHFWVNTTAKQTSFTFPVLASYTPNVYVNISLLQKHSKTVNDLPIRMYGIIPLKITDPETELSPVIEMADEFRPEETTTISVSEAAGKPMTYTLAVVDEGLLDLTRFRTPNPWYSFYARQSLGVRTWDLFDDVIGAYGGRAHQILSIGGDEAEAGSKNKKANRFKPMVKFIGPFTLEKGKTKTHKISIPKYLGSVRAMVVASDAKNEAYGSAEKTAFVRKPLMVLASLPRKITPAETVSLPVTVFAMKPSVKNVKVRVLPDDAYTVIGADEQRLSFAQPDEKMAYFTLKIDDFKGVGKVTVEARSGSEKASFEVEIDVLNPNPVTSKVEALVLKGKEKASLSFETFGTAGTNVATVELSSIPAINFGSRMEYLIQYPHGCVEQTTSSAFPQLFLKDIFDLSEEKLETIDQNIKATINRLSNFQLSSGGLSYWQGGSYANQWGTSYAGHFMLEAAKKGYVLPIGFKGKWISYQKQQARNWRFNSDNGDDMNQAYRLYTLCVAKSPDLASMNRLRETNGISNQAKMRLAAAYALIGKKAIARTVMGTLGAVAYKRTRYYNYGSEDRSKAMALETYSLMNDEAKSIALAKELATALSSEQWMSTQTTAYCLLAMSQYALKNKGAKGIDVKYSLGSVSEDVSTSKSFYTQDVTKLSKKNVVTLKNNSEGTVYVRLINKGILPVGKEIAVQRNIDVQVNYKSKSGATLNPQELTQGTNFVAVVTIRNSANRTLNDVALTQYIPSGWEIINTRYTDYGGNAGNAAADYTDIRDASISQYFNLKAYETKTFTVLLNASYLGEFYLPGAQAEAMYDNNYFARTQGQWVKVIK
ncbi:conserved exported hypothetical protein [Tenacibaculum litopenaei]|uniref:alpha-2-macroglobulin family protein n=1 Tax=Tenacibaculum litopenaei TaxID=396016 RepID=UPI003895F8C4